MDREVEEGGDLESERSQLQKSLRAFVGRIAERAARVLVSPFFVARDLILFRDHANRKRISPDDVVLIARKTPFSEHLAGMLGSIRGRPCSARKSE
jgi:histone H3/H4